MARSNTKLIKELESRLEHNASDIDARVQLVQAYALCTSQEKLQRRLSHVLWMIEHCPDSDELESPIFLLNELYSDADFQKARQLWLANSNDNPDNASIAGNAGLFLIWRDFLTGDELLEKAALLCPNNPKWYYYVEEFNWYQVRYGEESAKRARSAERVIRLGGEAIKADNGIQPSKRLNALEHMVHSAMYLGQLDQAVKFCEQRDRFARALQREDALQIGIALRGFVALQRGQIDQSRHALLELANGYKPAYSILKLADGLLQAGEQSTVLQFLSQSKELGMLPEAARWIADIKRGEIPHMDYP